MHDSEILNVVVETLKISLVEMNWGGYSISKNLFVKDLGSKRFNKGK